ncbi:hypothetical protein LIER_36815 [Lithospermum erythrorhizon]|uniref:Uncharacterized protein n=1 Tax=Lithospermum erythrorhizon TaxID=34254 RepID=A0AAV3PBS9_LITER
MKSDDEELKDNNFTAIDGSPQRRLKKQHISLKSETEESLSKEHWLCIFLGVNFLKVEDNCALLVHQLIAKSLNGNHFEPLPVENSKKKRNNGGL